MVKKTIMLILIGALFLFQACYDDYKENFDYTTTYFPRQFPLRTLVEEDGKDLTFQIGAVLGGKYSNDVNEEIAFQVQDTFLNADNFPQYTMLPENYYTIENTNITIPSGKFNGNVTVTLDKDAFLSDPLANTNHYALPVEITEASTDSILANRYYSVIVLKYINKYQGWYYTSGTDTQLDGSGTTSTYTYTFEDYTENSISLQTLAKNELSGSSSIRRGHLDPNPDDPNPGVPNLDDPSLDEPKLVQLTFIDLLMVIESDGTTVTLTESPSPNVIGFNGSGTYNPETRNFDLNYSYTDGAGTLHTIEEILSYRNTELNLEDWQ